LTKAEAGPRIVFSRLELLPICSLRKRLHGSLNLTNWNVIYI